MSKHAIETCRFTDNKFLNKTPAPFIGSSGHALLVAEFRPRAYIPTCVEREALSGQKKAQPSSSSGSSSSSSTQPKRGKLSHLLSAIKSSSDFISVTLSCSQETDTMEKRLVEAVLDTGNHASDFVASRIIKKLNLRKYIIESNSKTVCSGLDNACYDTSKSMQLLVSYFDELSNKYDVFEIAAVVLEKSPLDLILSKSTILKYDLVHKIPSQFFSTTPITGVPLTPACGNISCGCLPIKASRIPKGTSSPKRGMFASLIRESERLSTVSLPDEDEIDHVKTDTFAPW